MTTIEFIKKLNDGNLDLVHKMEGAKDIDTAYEIAKAEGVTDNRDVFYLTMRRFMKAMDEITENDFETIVGGASTTEIVSAVSTYTAAAATAGAAAAV